MLILAGSVVFLTAADYLSRCHNILIAVNMTARQLISFADMSQASDKQAAALDGDHEHPVFP